MFRIFLFLLGILFLSIGLSFIIIYLNLLNMGYSILDYVNFIIRRCECLITLLGIIFIILSMRKGKKNGIHL